jgi:hypothetical protein
MMGCKLIDIEKIDAAIKETLNQQTQERVSRIGDLQVG